jgi:nicotinate-nucleotide adenylyltransferase
MILDFSKPTVLYGGSFDPPHLAHLKVAEAARKALPDAQVVLVPCLESPGKPKPLASGTQRVKWLKDLGTQFPIWEAELQRSAPSYTIDTLKAAKSLGAHSDRLFWLVGSDAYSSIPNWREGQELRKYCKFLVVQRPNFPLVSLETGDLLVEMEECPFSSSSIREQLKAGKVPEEGLTEALKEEMKNLFLLQQNPYGKN